jgi:hypothetical protein
LIGGFAMGLWGMGRSTVKPLKVLGEVDFLHAFREASLNMFERAEKKKVFEELIINVLGPEDLIGLKLQAIKKNNPERKQQEMGDILFLVETYKNKMDWAPIERYAKILDMEDAYRYIVGKE